MRKIGLLFLLGVPLFAQPSNPSIVSVTSAPSGACTAGLPNRQVVSTGTQYSCQNGTWGAIGGGSGSGTVNSGTINQIGYYAGAGTAISGTSTPTSTFLDTGGQVFNVKSYGATGDGTTDDTAAITAAIAAVTTATHGTLYFPQGTYLTATCGFTLSVPTHVIGVMSSVVVPGGGPATAVGSTIKCNNRTASLFTVTADISAFDNITLLNSSTLAPTAGAGITATSATTSRQSIFVQNCYIGGFYDNISDTTTGNSLFKNNQIVGPVRYGIHIENTILADDGGWTIDGNGFQSNSRTDTTISAAIHQVNAGGGKIINNNSNGVYWHNAYLGGATGTIDFIVSNNIFDQSNSTVWNATSGLTAFTMTGNMFASSGNNAVPVIFTGMTGFVVANNYIATSCTGGCPAYAIQNLGSSTLGYVGMNFSNGYTTALTNMASTSNQSNWWTLDGTGSVVTTPDKIITTYGANPQLSITPASGVGAGILIQARGSSATGPASISLDKGAAAAVAEIQYSDNGTLKYRAGMTQDDTYSVSVGTTHYLNMNATGAVTFGATKFTATGCTSITSTVGLGTSGKFTIGGNSCTVVITLNGATGVTAANGWSCRANDVTTAAGNTGLYFSANTTTTATLTVPSGAAASDVIDFSCQAY